MREADVARAALNVMGLNVERVVFERESRNTFENARNLKSMVAPQANEKWLVVMSALNMPRAVGVFRAAVLLCDLRHHWSHPLGLIIRQPFVVPIGQSARYLQWPHSGLRQNRHTHHVASTFSHPCRAHDQSRSE